MVKRFATSPPNPELVAFAAAELERGSIHLLDIGCGAGSNAVPLARMGWNVLGLDLSEPMLEAANRRAEEEGLTATLRFAPALMEQLPVEDDSFDFIVAHGIWNLARSSTEFRQAVREAARAARPNYLYLFPQHASAGNPARAGRTVCLHRIFRFAAMFSDRGTACGGTRQCGFCAGTRSSDQGISPNRKPPRHLRGALPANPISFLC